MSAMNNLKMTLRNAVYNSIKKYKIGTPWWPVAKTSRSQRRSPGSIHAQGTRSHVPQQRLGTAKEINVYF